MGLQIYLEYTAWYFLPTRAPADVHRRYMDLLDPALPRNSLKVCSNPEAALKLQICNAPTLHCWACWCPATLFVSAPT